MREKAHYLDTYYPGSHYLLKTCLIFLIFFTITWCLIFIHGAQGANTHLYIEGSKGSALNSPVGMAINPRGILYIVNTLRKKVMVFDTDGQLVTEFGQEGLSQGNLQIPWDITLNSQGNIYVSDIGRHIIIRFSPQGKYEFEFSHPKEGVEFLPMGISWEKGDRLFVADAQANKIHAFNAEGKLEFSFGQEGSKDGELQYPVDLATSKGRIFVVDSGNFRVQVFDRDGKFLQKFGSAGSGPGEFSLPKSIEIDSMGNIFVADAGNRKVQSFDKDFNYRFSIDKEDDKNYFFQSPVKLVSFDQDLFVTDSVKNRLVRFNKVSQYFGGCLRCHGEKRQKINQQHVHAPYLNNCEHCHQKHGEKNQLLLVEDGDNLCMMCHAAMEKNLFKEHHNFPVNNLSCVGCHDPHASDENRLLIAHNPVQEKNCEACHTVNPETNKISLTAKVPDLCNQCHESKQNNQIIHSPVDEGDCLKCHDVHSNKNKPCLIKNGDELCQECHSDINRKVHQGHNPYPSVTTLSRKINRKIEGVAVNKKGQALCINCHQPHCSENRKLLKERYVSCMGIGCHSSWP